MDTALVDPCQNPEGISGNSPRTPDKPDPIVSAFAAIASRLASIAGTEPEVAAACRALGTWLCDVAEAASGTEAAQLSKPEQDIEAKPDLPVTVRRLTLGGIEIPVSVYDDGTEPAAAASNSEQTETRRGPSPADLPAPSVSLPTVAARARVKADCCRWAIERRKRMDDAADFDQLIKPTDSELATRLRALPNCIAWPLDPYRSLPDDRILDDAAECYDTLADVVELTERIRGNEQLFEPFGQAAYELFAECNSALLNALDLCGISKDLDQTCAFDWLRERVLLDRVYIDRHMKLSDPADPSGWPERREAIQRLADEVDAVQAEAREVRNLIGRLGYIANRWQDYDDSELPVQAGKIAEAVTRLVALGLKPSDRRIRDPLLRVLDDLPEGIDPDGAFEQALRFADEYAARREAEPQQDHVAEPPPTREVTRARELLAGKVVVMIGGHCRPRSRDAIRDALGLRELRWITTREHESTSNFEADVRRSDVSLVMLAVRWSSHSFEGIKAACDATGKPYVRLPRGYGVNQVAREIVNQVSEAMAVA